MVLTKHTIFQDPPDDLDETWQNGALLGGMVEDVYDCLAIADTFKLAGDCLVKSVPSKVEGYEVVYPILFNYRHSLELYLKAVVRPSKRTHNLQTLLQHFIEYIENNYNTEPPTYFKRWILEFDEFDKKSDAFRYHDVGIVSSKTNGRGEFWIDFVRLGEIMNYFQKCFHRIAKGWSAPGI